MQEFNTQFKKDKDGEEMIIQQMAEAAGQGQKAKNSSQLSQN